MADKPIWLIQQFDGQNEIRRWEIDGDHLGENNQVQFLLKALTARLLSFDEIIDSCVSKRHPHKRDLLNVKRDGHGLSFSCGENPFFTARFLDKAKTTAIVLFLLCVVSTACDSPRQPTGSSTALPTGRYVFHMEPTSANALGGGYLLDSATGDMWLVTHSVENGKVGPAVLSQIPRGPVRRYNPATGKVEQ